MCAAQSSRMAAAAGARAPGRRLDHARRLGRCGRLCPPRLPSAKSWEEAGFRVKARKLIGVYDANRLSPLELFHAFKLVFLCELIDGDARPSYETSEVGFFARGEIPEQLSGERTRPRHILDAFAALADPECPTVFD